MATKPKKRKRSGKVKIKTGAKVVKKDSVRKDSFPNAPIRLAGENGANFRVKLRRKK